MRTEQIIYFLETVQTGSFTKAANNLHIQQPSLREAIINMENELGHPLFSRSKKGVELTDYGRYCLPHLQMMYDSYQKMCLGANEPEALQKEIKIDVQSNFNVFLSTFYTTIQTQLSPQMISIMTNDDVTSIATKLIQGKSDLGFIYTTDLNDSKSLWQILGAHNLDCSSIKTFEVAVLMHKSHPLASKKSISYKDFYNYALIINSASAPVLDLLNKKLDLSRLHIIKTTVWRLIENYLVTTNAITFTAQESNDNPNLVLRPLQEPYHITLQAIYSKGTMDRALVQCINTMKLTVDNLLII